MTRLAARLLASNPAHGKVLRQLFRVVLAGKAKWT